MSKPATQPSEAVRAKPKGPGGRPEAYNQTWIEEVTRLKPMAPTMPEIAKFLGVTQSTVYLAMERHPEFSEAVKAVRFEADGRVEASLYRKAVGYERTVTKVFFPSGSKEPVKVDVIEEVAPDTASIIFWLKNRRPDMWRDRQDFRVSSGDGAQQIDTEALEMLVLSKMKDVTPPDDRSAGLDDDNPEEAEG